MRYTTAVCSPGRVKTWLLHLHTLLLLGMSASTIHAADQKSQADTPVTVNTVGANELANVTLGLLVVLALIFGIAWLFRRYGNLNTFNRSSIQILGGVSLGPREKAVLLEVEGERLLVGVASGQVTKLHSFPAGQVDVDIQNDAGTSIEQSQKGAFAETLQQQKDKGNEVAL